MGGFEGVGKKTQMVRELIRHILLRCGLAGAVDLLRRWRGRSTSHKRLGNLSDIFSHIYTSHAWVVEGSQDSLSGTGSTKAATSELIVQLSEFLRETGCRKLVDIGCGDFNWMRNVEGDFDYLGIDVVPQLIDAHNAAYASHRRKFLCMDASGSAIPCGDVALCREVLFHLSFHHGLQLLRNIKAAGFQYVLLTNDRCLWFNTDIQDGDYRRINLLKPPYNFPEPLRELADDKGKDSHGRVMGVWRGAELPCYSPSIMR